MTAPGAAHARWASLAVVALLTALALVLRLALDIHGMLDTDAINFGLAALSFDLLQHQPQPPGYPGYVLLLKGIHVLAPSLSPIEIAKWGSRICGVATVPAVFWAAGKVRADSRAGLEDRGPLPVRRLFAAAFAAVTPVLWYYGSDGQAHAAEALVTVLLFGAVADARARRDLSRRRVLLVAAVFGLAGSVRPTVVALGFPLLVWLLWRRPLLEWLLVFLVGLATTAMWFVPVVELTGGWELYRRVSDALFRVFYDSYSVFGARTTGGTLLANAGAALWAFLFCMVPLVALAWPRRMPTWGLAAMAVALVNLLFYALVYIAESGYLAGVAGLACLAPLTWPRPVPRAVGLRGALGLIGAVAVTLFAPSSVPLPVSGHPWLAPTLSHTVDVEGMQRAYHRVVCGATDGQPSLVITDNPTTTHTRALTLSCPNVVVGLYLHRNPLQPRWDNWLIFDGQRMQVLPPPVPLEPGPPATRTLMRPVARVVVAPDSSQRLKNAVRSVATCPVQTHRTAGVRVTVELFPARCVPVLRLGSNRLRVRALDR